MLQWTSLYSHTLVYTLSNRLCAFKNVLLGVVGRLVYPHPPKDVYVLITRPYEYIILHGKGELINAANEQTLKRPIGPSVITVWKREAEESEPESILLEWKGITSQGTQAVLETWKKRSFFPRAFKKQHSHGDTLILAHWDSFKVLTFRPVRW